MSDLTGPDVSGTAQGAIDWPRVPADFAFIKKSQGRYFSDSHYAQNLAGALMYDVPAIGSYHYMSYNYLPADQIPHYLKGLPLGRCGLLPPVLDFENWSDSGEGGPPRELPYMLAWAHDCIIQIHALTGELPILYSYVSFLKRFKIPDDPFINCPLWIADYRPAGPGFVPPEIPGPWKTYAFHQFTSKGTLPGVSGRVDLNRFNGSMDQLRVLAHYGN